MTPHFKDAAPLEGSRVSRPSDPSEESKGPLDARGEAKTTVAARLPEAFESNRFQYRQVHREETFAIYSQSKKGKAPMAFELVRIRVAPESEINGRHYPEREVYPKSEAWGQDAWTLRTVGEALAKLAAVRRRRS